jgi:hypothetical protein
LLLRLTVTTATPPSSAREYAPALKEIFAAGFAFGAALEVAVTAGRLNVANAAPTGTATALLKPDIPHPPV